MLIDSGCIASSSTDLLKRINIMKNGLKEVVEKYKPDKVIAEEVRPENGMQNLKTHRALMWTQAAIALMLYDYNKKLEMELIYPSS